MQNTFFNSETSKKYPSYIYLNLMVFYFQGKDEKKYAGREGTTEKHSLTLSNSMGRYPFSIGESRVSIQESTIGFQPTSRAFMNRIPALDTVAGVAVFRWEISNMSLIDGFKGIRSLEARVST